MRKKKLFFIVAALVSLLLYSCDNVNQDDFDDLKKDVEKNTQDISDLKTLTSSLQSIIDNKQVITNIESVTKEESGRTISGIKVTFSGDGGTKIIWDDMSTLVWINSNGHWATNTGPIPTDKDNAKYEIKDAQGNPISARGIKGEQGIPGPSGEQGAPGKDGHKIEVINQNGFVVFKVTDPSTSPATVTTVPTTVPFNSNAKILQSMVQNDYNVVFTVDGVSYSVMREISYPTSITMLANTVLIKKGKTASFNVKINPSNALVTKEMLGVDYVKSMSRAASVINKPDFIKIASCEITNNPGEYMITIEWLKDFPMEGNAIFIVASTKNNLGNNIEIISSTPVILTEKFVPIEDGFISNFQPIAMFQGETYTDYIALTKGADDKYIWNAGYVGATSISITTPMSTTDVTTTIDATDKFKFEVVAKVVSTITTVKDYISTVVVKDIATPTVGSINKNIPIKVYPLVDVLIDKTDVPNNWIPIERKNNYVNMDFSTALTDAGYLSTVWNIESTAIDYKYNASAANIPTSIAVYPNAIATKSIKIDILPEIAAGVHEFTYSIKATAKEGQRPSSLPQTRTFKIKVKFEIKAPVFHIALNPNINKPDITSFAPDGVVGKYSTIVNNPVLASDVFVVESCTNVSNSYKAEYNITENSPSYTYVNGSGVQGFMTTFPANVDWVQSAVTYRFYSALKTGQQIPVYIKDYVSGANPHLSAINPGVVKVQYNKRPLDHVVTMPYKTLAKACFNYSELQNRGFNINSEYTIFGENISNKVLHSTCITSVTYKVLDNSSTLVGLPKQLLDITAEGYVTAKLNQTWDTNVTVAQPIEIIMTDIWGNSKSAIVNILLNSNSIPTRS